MKIRIIKQPTGKLLVIYPAPKSRYPGETEEQWLDRVFAKVTGDGIVYKDLDSSQLPDRTYRDAWELDDDTGEIKINSIKLKEIQNKKLISQEKEKFLEEMARQRLGL